MTPRRRQDTPLRATLRTWVAIVWLFVIAAGNAKATWSIVAVDNETGEVGIAGASCISSSYVIAGVSPGYGVIAAQAYLSLRGRDRGVQLLADRATPSEVIELLTNRSFDRWWLPLYRFRQYGVAALGQESRAFTGESNSGWAGDAQGVDVSVQGNMLYGPEVVRDVLSAYESARRAGSSLAERLLLGLEAGAAVGEDSRCPRARAAISAFLIVARPEDPPDQPWLSL